MHDKDTDDSKGDYHRVRDVKDHDVLRQDTTNRGASPERGPDLTDIDTAALEADPGRDPEPAEEGHGLTE